MKYTFSNFYTPIHYRTLPVILIRHLERGVNVLLLGRLLRQLIDHVFELALGQVVARRLRELGVALQVGLEVSKILSVWARFVPRITL